MEAELAQPSFADAYVGAREDLSIWKRRALTAEASLRSRYDALPTLQERAQRSFIAYCKQDTRGNLGSTWHDLSPERQACWLAAAAAACAA